MSSEHYQKETHTSTFTENGASTFNNIEDNIIIECSGKTFKKVIAVTIANGRRIEETTTVEMGNSEEKVNALFVG